MPTLKDVITDVLANPEKYAGAFPVAEPELPQITADIGSGLGAALSRETFEAMMRQLAHR